MYQRAESLLVESATKLPNNPQVQYHLGMVYAQVGNNEKARKALTAAINLGTAFEGKDEATKTLAGLK